MAPYRLCADATESTDLYELLEQQSQLVVVLNTRHPFYRDVYSPLASSKSTRDQEIAVQLGLMILAEARAEAGSISKQDRDSALVVDYDEYAAAIASVEHSRVEMEHIDDARAEQVLVLESEVPTPRDRAYAEWSNGQLPEEVAETQRGIADTLRGSPDHHVETSRGARFTYDELVVTLNTVEEELSLRDLDLPELLDGTIVGFSRPQVPDLVPGTTHDVAISATPTRTRSGPSIER